MIVIRENEIDFSCTNLVNVYEPAGKLHTGRGLELIRQRLDLAYRDRHRLDIQRTGEYFRVNLLLHTHAD